MKESIIYCSIIPNAIGFKSAGLIQTELWKFQRSRISNCKPTTLPNEIKWLDYILTHVIMHLTKNLWQWFSSLQWQRSVTVSYFDNMSERWDGGCCCWCCSSWFVSELLVLSSEAKLSKAFNAKGLFSISNMSIREYSYFFLPSC